MEGVQLQRNTALDEAGCAETALRLRQDCAEIAFTAPRLTFAPRLVLEAV